MSETDLLEFEIKKTISEITKAVFSVVQELGHQFDDQINEACLRKELSLRDISYIRVSLPVYYKGHRIDDANFKSYLIVNDLVFVEINSMLLSETFNPSSIKACMLECFKSAGIVVNFMNNNKNDMIQIVMLDS